jgi:PAS domain S-box-containing protein/putative nucleotidyltransferase with HDIG domain
MTGEKITPAQGDALRRRAEDVFQGKTAGMKENLEALSPEETRQTLHELQVHQIELEMQNGELRRAQAELDASRARYFDLYDLAPVGYFTLSDQGLILEANLTPADLLGVTRNALVKQPLTHFILPADQDIYYRHRKLLFETRTPQMCEMRMVKKDAAPFWAQMEARLTQDVDGAPVYRAVMIDITARKQAEEELRESEEKYRNILENIEDGYFEVDLAGNFTFFNPSLCRILGYPREEMSGMNNRVFMDAENAKKVFRAYNEVYVTGIPAKGFEWEAIRKDGARSYIEVSVSLIARPGEKPTGFRGITRDVTERRRAESEIQAMARFPSENPSPILRIARDGTLLYANEAGLSQLPDWHLNAGQGVPSMIRDVVTEAMTSGKTRLLDLEHRGQVYSFFVAPIADAGYANLYGRNITERKRAEEQLRESLEQLRRAVETTIQVLVMAVEMKDPDTAGHQRRMTKLARTMATEMGLPPEKVEGLRMAGVIHDIGKITLPTEVLSKPTKLSAIELSLIREHVRLGYEILKEVQSPWPLAEIVLQHHERMDGSGYPRGLKGEEILIEARILAVADVVEAMASHRPYRPALGIDAALTEIEKNRGLLYDSHAADTCLRVFREKGYQIEGT